MWDIPIAETPKGQKKWRLSPKNGITSSGCFRHYIPVIDKLWPISSTIVWWSYPCLTMMSIMFIDSWSLICLAFQLMVGLSLTVSRSKENPALMPPSYHINHTNTITYPIRTTSSFGRAVSLTRFGPPVCPCQGVLPGPSTSALCTLGSWTMKHTMID